MNEQEMMNNEVMDVAEVTQNSSGNGLKVVGGLVAVAGLIYGGYKLLKKREAKKDESVVVITEDNIAETYCDKDVE